LHLRCAVRSLIRVHCVSVNLRHVLEHMHDHSRPSFDCDDPPKVEPSELVRPGRPFRISRVPYQLSVLRDVRGRSSELFACDVSVDHNMCPDVLRISCRDVCRRCTRRAHLTSRRTRKHRRVECRSCALEQCCDRPRGGEQNGAVAFASKRGRGL
jgi:hypothetical protein